MAQKDYAFFGSIHALLERAKVTRREMQILSWMIQLQKDRSGLKTKLAKERTKAKNEKIEMLLHPCLLNLMTRAEAGRDISV